MKALDERFVRDSATKFEISKRKAFKTHPPSYFFTILKNYQGRIENKELI